MYEWACIQTVLFKGQLYFTSVVFLRNTHNPSPIIRKTSEKLQLEGILQNTWLVLLTIVKDIKNQESLRNRYSCPRRHA